MVAVRTSVESPHGRGFPHRLFRSLGKPEPRSPWLSRSSLREQSAAKALIRKVAYAPGRTEAMKVR